MVTEIQRVNLHRGICGYRDSKVNLHRGLCGYRDSKSESTQRSLWLQRSKE